MVQQDTNIRSSAEQSFDQSLGRSVPIPQMTLAVHV